ncbi:MAG TPA: AI-2E family transporter [Acholeplasmataceae bacterium]|nr:AI-2E family transporter [Acholeplasmataceae bacterium]HRX44589.1 AI-2E family transporter [Acholeplasmataceae bacterium]
MNKPWLTKEKLIHYLLIVSLITITIVGLYFLQLLTKNSLIRVYYAVNSVLIPFIIAFFLSFIIGPLSLFIHQKLKIKRGFAIIIAIFIGIIFILGVLGIAIYFIVTQMSSILDSLLTYIDNESLSGVIQDIMNAITAYFESSDITDLITEMTQNGASIERILGLAGSILVSLSGFASSLFGIIMIFVLTPVFMFYLIREKEYIFSNIAKVAPKKIRPHVIELGKRSDVVIRNYFKGQGLMMLIIFLYFGITLSILSLFVPAFPVYYALIFATLMGLFNIIPYLGAWLGVMAPLVFLLTEHLELQLNGGGNIFLIAMVIVVILQLIEQVLEGSIIQPNVLGKQVHIHPLAVLSALLFFGGVFGFAGVLLAVPMTGTIKASLDYFGELNDKTELDRIKENEEQEKMNDKKTTLPKKSKKKV